MSGPPLVTFALTPQTLLGLVLVIRDSWGLNKLLRAFSLGGFPSFVKQKGFLFVFDKKKNVELTENYTDRRVIRNDLQLMSPQSRQLKADLYLRLSEDLTLPPPSFLPPLLQIIFPKRHCQVPTTTAQMFREKSLSSRKA